MVLYDLILYFNFGISGCKLLASMCVRECSFVAFDSSFGCHLCNMMVDGVYDDYNTCMKFFVFNDGRI